MRVAHTGIGMVAAVTFDHMGRLVDIGSVRNSDGTPGSQMARLHRHPDGSVDTVRMADPERQAAGRTTVERRLGDTPVTLFVYQPFGPLWLHAHGPRGAWAEALTSDYSVVHHHADGGMSRIEGPQPKGLALSPEERKYAEDRIARDLQRLDLDEHPFDIPDSKPPLAAIYFDRAGRLWVEKARAHGAEMREADVYEGAALVARYRWPSRVDPGSVPWIGESAMLGTTRDEFDVQRVARVRFRRYREAVIGCLEGTRARDASTRERKGLGDPQCEGTWRCSARLSFRSAWLSRRAPNNSRAGRRPWKPSPIRACLSHG